MDKILALTGIWNKYCTFFNTKRKTINSDKITSLKKLLSVMKFRSHVHVYVAMGDGTVATPVSVYTV
jgi:hypothetical protein